MSSEQQPESNGRESSPLQQRTVRVSFEPESSWVPPLGQINSASSWSPQWGQITAASVSGVDATAAASNAQEISETVRRLQQEGARYERTASTPPPQVQYQVNDDWSGRAGFRDRSQRVMQEYINDLRTAHSIAEDSRRQGKHQDSEASYREVLAKEVLCDLIRAGCGFTINGEVNPTIGKSAVAIVDQLLAALSEPPPKPEEVTRSVVV